MKIATVDDVQEALGAHLPSAVLNKALAVGLFWELEDGARSAAFLAQRLGIAPQRCHYWLRLLASMDLLQQEGDEFAVSDAARTAILATHARDTWRLLAVDAGENFVESLGLVERLAMSDGEQAQREATRDELPRYVREMKADLERARLFARALFELHSPLAQDIADSLAIDGARRLLDVGGGSGVVSLALLKRHPELTAVVADIANSCVAGREIADAFPERERISYLPVEFDHDELPEGFDIVLKCDVMRFEDPFLARLAAPLNDGGSVVIVDRWFDLGEAETPRRLAFLMRTSMRDPAFSLRRLEDVEAGLAKAGLVLEPTVELSYYGWKMIRARKVPVQVTGNER